MVALAFGYAPIAIAAKNKAFWVEVPGIEAPATYVPIVAKRREDATARGFRATLCSS
jgi:hypothetical protein